MIRPLPTLTIRTPIVLETSRTPSVLETSRIWTASTPIRILPALMLPALMLPALMLAALMLAALLPLSLSAQQGEMKDMDTFPRPIAMADNVWIEELTMLEVRDRLDQGWRTALVLTGGIEENGPYLTTGKHNHVLRVMGDAIARELGQTLVAPIITVEPGSPERASTPGGIRYSQETFRAVLRDYAVSLRAQGFRNIFFLGDSGGNRRGMAQVAEELQEEWAGEDVVIAHIPEYYNYDDVLAFQRDELGVDEDPRLEGLHDDYYITTIIMHDDPEHVRFQQRVEADKASINGIAITPLDQALEHGRRLIEFRTDVTVEAIRAAMAEGRRP